MRLGLGTPRACAVKARLRLFACAGLLCRQLFAVVHELQDSLAFGPVVYVFCNRPNLSGPALEFGVGLFVLHIESPLSADRLSQDLSFPMFKKEQSPRHD